MKASRRKAVRQRKEVAKIAGITAGTAISVAGGIIAAMTCKKKKVYEDSMTDVKTSEELL